MKSISLSTDNDIFTPLTLKHTLYVYYLYLASNKMILIKSPSPIQASCEGSAHVVRRLSTIRAEGILPYNISLRYEQFIFQRLIRG